MISASASSRLSARSGNRYRQQLTAAAGPGLGHDRHPGRAQRLQVAVDGPDADAQLGGQGTGRDPAPGLEQQDQGHQAVGAHPLRLVQNR